MLAGSVLFSSRAPIGYVAIAANEITTNQGFKSFVLPSEVNNHFVYYYLKHIKPVAEEMATGTTFKELSGAGTAKLPLVVAPLNEQKRIADKLDAVLERVDACRDRLDRIPIILKRFRQSVLAAATSGKLTEEWRGTVNIDWKAVTLEAVANIVDPHPSHRTPKEVFNGAPYIGIGDLKADGSIDFESARKVSMEVLEEHKARYKLKKGDFVFGKIGTLGKATVLPVDREYTLSANVILVQPLEDYVRPTYLMFFLSSPETMKEVSRQSNSTSQAAFGIKKMRAFKCKIPGIEEQTEIIRRVETLFAYADRLEDSYSTGRAKVEKLTPATLAKAFRGELVPQDPNDEPASVLLERIKVSRVENKVMLKPKRGRNKTASTAPST